VYIDLIRTHPPEEAASEEACEICGERFTTQSVPADVSLDGTAPEAEVVVDGLPGREVVR
jgi:hypothetical protein